MPKTKKEVKGEARKIRVFQGNDHAIVEVPPCQRTIFVRSTGFYVSFPYIVFDIRYQYDDCRKKYYVVQIRIGFRNKPISKNATSVEVGQACLPNVDTNFALCLGDTHVIPAKTIGDLIMNALKVFWATSFNTSMDSRSCYTDARVKTFTKWAANSANNPDFITHVTWPERREFDL